MAKNRVRENRRVRERRRVRKSGLSNMSADTELAELFHPMPSGWFTESRMANADKLSQQTE